MIMMFLFFRRNIFLLYIFIYCLAYGNAKEMKGKECELIRYYYYFRIQNSEENLCKKCNLIFHQQMIVLRQN